MLLLMIMLIWYDVAVVDNVIEMRWGNVDVDNDIEVRCWWCWCRCKCLWCFDDDHDDMMQLMQMGFSSLT